MIGTPADKKARYDPLRAIAAMSGGVAFYDRDDFEVGILDALHDGLVSYTLGFYPASEDTNAPVHQLGIRVSRPGVTLRYRTSYELKPQPPASANPVDDLVKAMNRPVDTTVIPITARATRNGDRVDLSVSLDVSSLDLELSEGLWKGKAELVTRFVTADGLPAGNAAAQTLTFNLRPATYESMVRGDPYRSHSDRRSLRGPLNFRCSWETWLRGRSVRSPFRCLKSWHRRQTGNERGQCARPRYREHAAFCKIHRSRRHFTTDFFSQPRLIVPEKCSIR